MSEMRLLICRITETNFTRATREVARHHCYSSYTRGTELLVGYHAFLDRNPKGRNEGRPERDVDTPPWQIR